MQASGLFGSLLEALRLFLFYVLLWCLALQALANFPVQICRMDPNIPDAANNFLAVHGRDTTQNSDINPLSDSGGMHHLPKQHVETLSRLQESNYRPPRPIDFKLMYRSTLGLLGAVVPSLVQGRTPIKTNARML